MSFWTKVEKCAHKNLSPNYFKHISCATPYCSGHETHCLDCGVYISECKCGFNSGMSGWSLAQWITHNKQKRKL